MTATQDLRYPSERDSGQYSVPGVCTNCGWVGRLILPHGREAPRGYRKGHCHACGCKTLTAKVGSSHDR